MGRLERLREVEREIEGSLQDASMGWTRVYRLVSEVAEERLWLDSYRSLASWMRSFGDRSKVSVNYLNRVLSAGRSYEAFQERSLAAGRPCPELSAAPVSALAVVEARRVSAGRPEAFDRLMGSLVSGETTPSEVRRMAAAGAGLRDRGRLPGTCPRSCSGPSRRRSSGRRLPTLPEGSSGRPSRRAPAGTRRRPSWPQTASGRPPWKTSTAPLQESTSCGFPPWPTPGPRRRWCPRPLPGWISRGSA